MQEFFAALLSFFLIEPLQSAMAERFGDISREQVASVTTCIREATPVLIQQGWDQPWGTATQVLGIWTGLTQPEDILAGTTQSCTDAVGALRATGNTWQS